MAKKLIQVVYNVNDQQLLKAEKSIKANEEAAKKADNQVKKFGKDAEKAGKQGEKSFFDLKNIIATIGLVALGKQIIAVTGQFQKFSAVLTNTLGSKSEAQKALEMIKAFAASTPFSVQELTASFVKLANQGFRPVAAQLKSLGDIAASQGKSFDQLTEAIIDAQTGEFERLKEFGIRAAKAGSNVTFTFKGVQTQVQFTSDSIREYILSLGTAAGVSGSMEAISGTLEGRISNLGDSFDNLLLTIGTLTSGPLFSVIESMTKLVTATANLNKELALIGQAVSPFHDLSDVAKETVDFLFKFGRTDAGKQLSEVLAPFTSQEAVQFLKDYDKNRASFFETLTKEGESLEDINVLWLRYVELQILAAKETKEAKAAARLLEVEKAANDAAAAVAKAKAEKEKIRVGGEAILAARRAKEAAVQEEKDASKEKLDVLKKYGEDYIDEIKGQIIKELPVLKTRTQQQIDQEEAAARRRMEIQQMVFDFSLNLLGQFLIARLSAEDEAFEKEKGNFDRRLQIAGDNERARMEIEAERQAFEEEQAKKAEASATEQAKKDKERQIKQMIIQGVLNSIRAIGNPPVPNFAAAGITALFSAAQVGIAKSVGFKEGGWITGPGTQTSDSIPIMASRDEFMVNAKAAGQSRMLLEAINDRRIDDRFLKQSGVSSSVKVDNSDILEELRKRKEPRYYEEGYFVNQVIEKNKNLKLHSRAKYFSK